MNVKELIKEINSLGKVQEEYWENIKFPEKIQEILDKSEIIEPEVNAERYTWYKISVVGYKYEDSYFGISFITNFNLEINSIREINYIIKAYPLRKILEVKYDIDEF
jgi:hypothetical protein